MTLRDPNDSNGGKLVLGGSDANLYTGEMNYIPLTRLGYWQVAMDSISVAGDKVWQLNPNLYLFTFSNEMYILTRGPWTATPALIKVNIKID